MNMVYSNTSGNLRGSTTKAAMKTLSYGQCFHSSFECAQALFWGFARERRNREGEGRSHDRARDPKRKPA